MQMHCLTCSIRPLWRNDRRFEERQFPLLVHLWSPKAACPFFPPPLSLTVLTVPTSPSWLASKGGKREREAEREIHRSVAIVERLLPRIVFISSLNPVAMALKMALQPLCLMISWMIAYLSGIHALFCWNARQRGMSCCCFQKGGPVILTFYLSLTGSENGVMGYFPNLQSWKAVLFPLPGQMNRVLRRGHLEWQRCQCALI